MGNRSDACLQKLISKVDTGKCIFVTDEWGGFFRILPEERHFYGKDLTFPIESTNSDLRITGIRRNMKNYLMETIEKIMLRKRFLIETLFEILKINMNLSHTRYRSPTNAYVNILSCLTAYQLKENKPAMKVFSNPLIQN